MKYNRSWVMKKAWESYRDTRDFAASYYTFAVCLRGAWYEHKQEVARAEFEAAEETRQNAPKTAAQVKAQDDLFILNMKDRWDDRDRAEVARLERIIKAA